MKLDKSRDYGVCYGDPRVAYVQDERYFGPDEQVLTELPKELTMTHSQKVRAGIARKKAQSEPTAA